MSTIKCRRLTRPQALIVGGAEILFTPWHCFELVTIATGDEYTKANVKDRLGRTCEVRHADLVTWPAVFMLERDFGSLYVGETVDLLDPMSSDGETVEVSDRGAKARVPVGILTPVAGHAYLKPLAV